MLFMHYCFAPGLVRPQYGCSFSSACLCFLWALLPWDAAKHRCSLTYAHMTSTVHWDLPFHALFITDPPILPERMPTETTPVVQYSKGPEPQMNHGYSSNEEHLRQLWIYLGLFIPTKTPHMENINLSFRLKQFPGCKWSKPLVVL